MLTMESDTDGSKRLLALDDKNNLLRTGLKPEWWDSTINKITYELLHDLMEMCTDTDVVIDNEETTIRRALLALDAGLLLPSKISNLKRKVKNQLKKKDFNNRAVADFLYDQNVLSYVGEICEKNGIKQTLLANIDSGCVIDLQFQKMAELTNGIVLELFQFKNLKNYTMLQFRNWLFFLVSAREDSFYNGDSKFLSALSKKVKDMSERKKDLIVGKKRDELTVFLANGFCFPDERHNTVDLDTKKELDMQKLLDASQQEMEKLIDEIADSNQKIEALTEVIQCGDDKKELAINRVEELENQLRGLKSIHDNKSTELLTIIDKLRPLSQKNVDRVVKRRDSKIKSLTEMMESTKKQCETNMQDLNMTLIELSKENAKQSNQILQFNEQLNDAMRSKERVQKMKWYYKNVAATAMAENIHENCANEINSLKSRIHILENKNCELEEDINLIKNKKIVTKENGRFTDDVRAVYQDLVCMGVGVNNVETVVSKVLRNIAKLSFDCLPKASFSRQMFLESRRLSQIQVAETLVTDHDTSNRTLHSDGTSKFGQHYGVYDVVSDDGAPLVVGLREMGSGNTETQLEVLQSILKEVEESLESSVTNVSKKIVKSIKNVMSDRHIVQKNFNKLFQQYRAGVLPDIVADWGNLSDFCRKKVERINEFFCGMHYVVGLADQTEVALKAWEKLLFGNVAVGSLANGGYSKGESGTYRLTRTVCKAVQTRGCEKSGRIGDFAAFVKEELGFPSVPLIPFRGNRFNVFFYNGGMCYYMRNHLKAFFDDVYEENKLLTAVHHDLQVPAFTTGCRALGLINKLITGPLWRLLESDAHIFEMNNHYLCMEKLFSDFAENSSTFMKGEVFFFKDIPISKDKVYGDLITSCENDEATQQCLELIFGSLSIVTKRMLHDHLEGGKYSDYNSDMVAETSSVSKTNNLAERNFGMIDRLIREKPNANLITYEAVIMSQTNKMSSWRDNLTPEKRSLFMKWARESIATQYNDFTERRLAVRKKVNEKRLGKIEEKRRRAAKLSIVKENLCNSIQKYNGLWLTAEQVDKQIELIDSEKEKREALKCQIQFRQKIILSCSGVAKKLFYLSEGGKNKPVNELCCNLKTLIDQLKKDKSISTNHSTPDNLNTVLPRNQLESEKSRLKCLLELQAKKNQESDGPSKSKKRKCSNKGDLIPIITCMNELVGKRVEHFIYDYDGKEKWCRGTVASIKPDSDSELIIRYDTEETLYSFMYLEFSDSTVRAISVTPEDFVGKSIQQKFTKDDDDEWWEVGNVISYDVTSKKITVNVYECDDDDYDDSDVLSYQLLDDYLNHDVRFM